MIPVFANPLLLWGLAAAAVPVVIHLLNRRRYRVQRWAAMEWLLAAARKNQKRLKMENLLLLLLRTCAVLFIALAIARPTFSDASLLLDRQASHLFILLDNSASTGARAGAGTALEGGLSAALSLLGDVGTEDPVTLVLTNDESISDTAGKKSGRARVVLRGTHDHAKVRQLVGELKPAAARADLVDGLAKLEEAVPARGGITPKVAIVTDLQRASFDGDGRGGASPDAAINSSLARLREKGAEVVLIPFGRPTPNVAITSLATQDDRDIVQGKTVMFEAEVKNFGDRPVEAHVRFSVDGGASGDVEQVVQLKPRPAGGGSPQPMAVQYAASFKDEGVHVLTATIAADNLTADDVRTFAFEVRKPIRVLAVDGDPNEDPTLSETYGLKGALALNDTGPITVTVKDESDFASERNLAAWDLVVLANVTDPAKTPEERRRLEDYVRHGGALFLTVGDRVKPAEWNRQLHDGPAPLLPARLGEARVEKRSADATSALQFDLSENSHPILKDITNPRAASWFRAPSVWGRLTLEGFAAEKGARSVMKYGPIEPADKSPALVERTVGKGRVLLLTTSIDEAWNSLPREFLFPVLLDEIAYYLTSHGNAERNLLAYQPWTRTLPPNANGVELVYPDGTQAPCLQEKPPDAPPYATAGDTSRLGAYKVTISLKSPDILSPAPAPVRDAFAVNLPAAESDLERLLPQDVESRFPGLAVRSGFGGAAARLARKSAGEFHVPLLAAALLCLVAEALLVRRIAKTRAQTA